MLKLGLLCIGLLNSQHWFAYYALDNAGGSRTSTDLDLKLRPNGEWNFFVDNIVFTVQQQTSMTQDGIPSRLFRKRILI